VIAGALGLHQRASPFAAPTLLAVLLLLTGCSPSSSQRPTDTAHTAKAKEAAPPEPGAPDDKDATGSQSAFDQHPPTGPIYQRGFATYYADSLAGRHTATGEPYDPAALTAAHRTLPFGAVVNVARSDGRYVTVRINDRGPFVQGRIIDLSRRAALALGLIVDGIARVSLRIVSLPAPKVRQRRR
jgi:rare lipoprotein A